MKKQVILIAFYAIICLISTIIFISMLNYSITFQDWYSFLSLKNAIIVVVISGLVLVLSFILMIIKIIGLSRKNNNCNL